MDNEVDQKLAKWESHWNRLPKEVVDSVCGGIQNKTGHGPQPSVVADPD